MNETSLKKRVKDMKRAYVEAGQTFEEARKEVQAVLKSVEDVSLRQFNEAIAPFLKTYRVETSRAFKKAQDEGIRIQDTLGVRENEAYQKLLQAEKEFREAEG